MRKMDYDNYFCEEYPELGGKLDWKSIFYFFPEFTLFHEFPELVSSTKDFVKRKIQSNKRNKINTIDSIKDFGEGNVHHIQLPEEHLIWDIKIIKLGEYSINNVSIISFEDGYYSIDLLKKKTLHASKDLLGVEDVNEVPLFLKYLITPPNRNSSIRIECEKYYNYRITYRSIPLYSEIKKKYNGWTHIEKVFTIRKTVSLIPSFLSFDVKPDSDGRVYFDKFYLLTKFGWSKIFLKGSGLENNIIIGSIISNGKSYHLKTERHADFFVANLTQDIDSISNIKFGANIFYLEFEKKVKNLEVHILGNCLYECDFEKGTSRIID